MANVYRIYVFRVAINCCTSCPEKLKAGLLRIEGIESVDVDPEKRLVRVKSYIDSKKIIKRIEGMGKSAQLLPEKTEENRPHAYKVVEIHDEEEKVREGSFFGSCLREGSSKDSSRRRREARSSHAPEKYEGERNVSSPKEFPEHICRDKYCTFHKRDSTLLSDRVPYMDYQPMFYGGATHSYPIRNTYVPPPPPHRQYGTKPPPQYRQYGQRMVPPVVGYGGGNQMPRPRGHGSAHYEYSNGCTTM